PLAHSSAATVRCGLSGDFRSRSCGMRSSRGQRFSQDIIFPITSDAIQKLPEQTSSVGPLQVAPSTKAARAVLTYLLPVASTGIIEGQGTLAGSCSCLTGLGLGLWI